jgi:hypothetical protein
MKLTEPILCKLESDVANLYSHLQEVDENGYIFNEDKTDCLTKTTELIHELRTYLKILK